MCVCRFRDLGSIVSRHSCVKSSKYYIYHKRLKAVRNDGSCTRSIEAVCGTYHVEVRGLSCVCNRNDPITVREGVKGRIREKEIGEIRIEGKIVEVKRW